MGQYEPDDSRDVTLTDGHEPGGIKRTGPREGEARREAKTKDGGKPLPQQQQQGQQSQNQSSGSGQKQSQGGNPESALDDPPGDPRPEYDQYAVNQPDNMSKPGIFQTEAQESGDSPAQDRDQPSAPDPEARAAYGNSQDEAGHREEQQADPDQAKRARQAAGEEPVGETSGDPAARAKADASRPLGES